MKNIFKLFAIFIFVPFVVYGAKPNNEKQQKQAQMRNEQTINHLLTLGRAYRHVNKEESKEKISTDIQHEVEHWYMENMQTLTQKQGVNAEDSNTIKQQLVTEIKAGKIPEIMLKTLPEKTAERIKQNMDMEKKAKSSKGGYKKTKGKINS